MRAWQFTTTTGGLEKNLKLNDAVPLPKLNPSRAELLVRVLSVSLNPADYKIPELGLVSRAVFPSPGIPCVDFCGVVVRTSSAGTKFKEGDVVFGQTDRTTCGSCAEFVVVPVGNVALLPSSEGQGIAVDEGATVSIAGLTAYQAIVPNAKAGDRVFVNGGGGGVGTFAIQIAKALGCFVTVSCSAGKAELCRRLGADEVVDYTACDVVGVMRGKGQVYQLCLDNVGAPEGLYKAADGFLKQDGLFCQVGAGVSMGAAGMMLSRMLVPSMFGGGKRRYQFFKIAKDAEALAQIARWIVEGKVKPVIEERFEMEDLPKAFEKLKSGRCYGKLVVHIAKGDS
ncbi:hypothetical protein QBC47DRAFT_420001 [Echria macrotheca]|uniref:Enoyl reductase (ER) domain-containing protein n=1 Tax=Echria macrotheca TaxID=438768 RepID=A0AAJ0BKH5_9PEZI|nr:hypothetical protein QBC47DRAFT_420001 [Echria macrotheca]